MATVEQSQLVAYLNELLNSDAFDDYAPNGLQVEGKPSISRLVAGVTASKSLLNKALSLQADAILVHHGYFWKGESPCIVGMKKHRLKLLLEHDVSLLGYHLPLDAHPVYGNNAQLGHLLGWKLKDILQNGLIYVGSLSSPQSLSELKTHIATTLNREPLCVSAANANISSVAWCTGAGQDFIEQVASLNVDAYISGEISERTYHQAKELGVNYLAAGHHATERYGIKALGEHLAKKFSIECFFVDVDNPV